MESSTITSKPRLIALYSPAPQSGKSTVGDVLINEYKFRRIKFAGPLKGMLFSLLFDLGYSQDIIVEMLEGNLKEKKIPEIGHTPRSLMKSLGTSWGRQQVKDAIWIDVTISRLQHLYNQGISAVVDDMRFANEWRALDAIGAEFWKITRPGIVESEDTTGVSCEGLLDNMPFDLHLTNDRTKEVLEYKARLAVEGQLT